MPEANQPLMPENVPESEQTPDTLVDAIVGKINDDIQDAASLRDKRAFFAKVLFWACLIFYACFLAFIVAIIWCPFARHFPIHAPSVTIVVLIALAAVPTLLALLLGKAVFGRRAQGETAFTPIHALLQIMKDMKGN